MSDFKAGDVVVYLDSAYPTWLTQGKTYKVLDVNTGGSKIIVKRDDGVTGTFNSNRFKIYTYYPNPPHKHADLIKAWADGADIECKQRAGTLKWRHLPYPEWNTANEYRIKPQLTEQQIKAKEIEDQLAKAEKEVKLLTMKLKEVNT